MLFCAARVIPAFVAQASRLGPMRSLEAQSYYAKGEPRYWRFSHAGWADRLPGRQKKLVTHAGGWRDAMVNPIHKLKGFSDNAPVAEPNRNV